MARNALIGGVDGRTFLDHGAAQVATRVDLLSAAGTVIASTSADVHKVRIKVIDGSWSQDFTRSIMSEAEITLQIDPATTELLPGPSPQPLTIGQIGSLSPAASTEFQLWQGFIDPKTGIPYYTSIGIFGFNVTDVTRESGAVKLTIHGLDRAMRLQRMKFIDAILYLLVASGNTKTFPTILTPTQYKTPLLSYDISETSNYLDAVIGLAEAVGYRLWFDSYGRCIVSPVHDPDVDVAGLTPQWVLGIDSDTKIVRDARQLSVEKTYNGVIMRGESSGSDAPPAEGRAWNTDPNSPTYYDPANPTASTFGASPYFEQSKYIVDNTQALWVATAKMWKLRGVLETITMEINYNPYIEVEDIIQVTDPAIGASGLYLVEAVSGSVKASTMQIKTRERRA